MKSAITATVLVFAAAVASADDATSPKPASPAPDAPKPAAKKERTTTPEAEAAVKKYVGLLHFPNPKYKTVQMNSHCEIQMLGGDVGCKFAMKEDGEVSLDISLSEAATRQYGEGQLKGIKKTAASWVGGLFKPFLVPTDVTMKQYDLTSRVENGKTVVEMKRFAENAAWDKATAWFNAEGLLEKQVGTPNVDPDDPMAAVKAGQEIEMTIEYKKRGDAYTIESGKMVDALGDSVVKITYFDIPGQPPLPKEVEVTTPMTPDPLAISLFDYVLGGRAVPGTERKVETKPAAPEPAKKVEPVKPGPAEPPK